MYITRSLTWDLKIIAPFSFCIPAVWHCVNFRRGGDLGVICQTLPRGSVVGRFFVAPPKNYFLLHRNLLYYQFLQLTGFLWYLSWLFSLKRWLFRVVTGTVHVVSQNGLQHQGVTQTFFCSIFPSRLGTSWLGRSPRNLLWKKTKAIF